MKNETFLSHLLTWLVAGFLLSPLVLCVLFSFTSRPIAAFPIPALTLDWYARLAAQDQFWRAALTTAKITLGCGFSATAVGLATALGLARLPQRIAVLLLLVLSLPLMLPPLVLGLSLLTYLNFIGIPTGVFATTLAHLVFTLPFVTAVIYVRVVTLDPSAIEAARDLGATQTRAFLTITLPLISTSIVGGLLIAMALSLDDFVIAFFTTSSNTLSILIWGMMRTTITPMINALGTGIICITLGIAAIALQITRYRG
ncbi:MAG: ABC transporter permease [Parvibaculaceae bacterium]|nr:ABC transporter permease [Parvibaculaceae bacterium]